MNKKNITLAIAFFLVLSLKVEAQFPSLSQSPQNGLPLSENFLNIKLSPSNPGPNQKVTASVEFYLTDLQKSEISWFLNGSLEKKSIGGKIFEFQTGSAGTISKISVLIDTFDGESVQKEISIRPADVDMVWNAQTYTPPFYKGKALFIKNSEIIISAIPDFINSAGKRINPKSLVYKWEKGRTILGNQSGVGRDTLKIESSVTLFRPVEIKVDVSTLDGTISASKTIVIKTENPKVLIYQKSPVLGIEFGNALKNIELKESEITLSAIPYFFNTLIKDGSDIRYSWSQNNKNIVSAERPHSSSVILRQTEDSSGRVNINVNVSDTRNLGQTASYGGVIEIKK